MNATKTAAKHPHFSLLIAEMGSATVCRGNQYNFEVSLTFDLNVWDIQNYVRERERQVHQLRAICARRSYICRSNHNIQDFYWSP